MEKPYAFTLHEKPTNINNETHYALMSKVIKTLNYSFLLEESPELKVKEETIRYKGHTTSILILQEIDANITVINAGTQWNGNY